MKKLILAILVLILALGAVGCAKKQNEGTAADEAASNTGFAVVVSGTTVRLGEDAAPALTALGTPKVSQEVFDCGAGNSRMFYRFASIDLYTMKTDGAEVIDQIELNDDLATTDKEICIGNTVEALKAAYGEPQRSDGDDLVYVSGSCELIVEIDDGRVDDIELIRRTNG